MAQETKQQEALPVLADDVIEKRLQDELPGWWYEGRWIRRKYNTDGWLTTLALVNTIGYLASVGIMNGVWRGGGPGRGAVNVT